VNRLVVHHNVFQLHRIREERAFELAARGRAGLASLPVDFRPTRAQAIQILAVQRQAPHLEVEGLRAFLAALEYPLYFLDFETIAPALPLFEGTSPWQQIPFQFSLHIQAEPGSEPRHLEFLATDPQDPRPEILARLQDWLGNGGSVVAYNAGFEQAVLQELAGHSPTCVGRERVGARVTDWFDLNFRPRLVDLLKPFRTFAYYHPAQRGSASLKAVLPALTGRSYQELAIRNGDQAGSEYLRLMSGALEESEQQVVRDQLRAYCGLDTWGMVMIVERLRKHAGFI
jgi:hypothetical protein